jgi:hypothetical protein
LGVQRQHQRSRLVYDRALSSGWFDRVYEDAGRASAHSRSKAEPPAEDKKDKDKPGDDDTAAMSDSLNHDPMIQ